KFKGQAIGELFNLLAKAFGEAGEQNPAIYLMPVAAYLAGDHPDRVFALGLALAAEEVADGDPEESLDRDAERDVVRGDLRLCLVHRPVAEADLVEQHLGAVRRQRGDFRGLAGLPRITDLGDPVAGEFRLAPALARVRGAGLRGNHTVIPWGYRSRPAHASRGG